MSREIGIPDAVLTQARALGVHNDCLVADVDGACEACVPLVMEAFRAVYGHLPSSDDVLETIVADLAREEP